MRKKKRRPGFLNNFEGKAMSSERASAECSKSGQLCLWLGRAVRGERRGGGGEERENKREGRGAGYELKEHEK